MSLVVNAFVDIPAGAIEVQPAHAVPAGRGVQITFATSDAAKAYRQQLGAALLQASALAQRQLPEPAAEADATTSAAYANLLKVRKAYIQAGHGCEGLLTLLYDRALRAGAGMTADLAADFRFAAEATFSLALALKAQEQAANIYRQLTARAYPDQPASQVRQRPSRNSPGEQGVNIASQLLGADTLPTDEQLRLAELAATHVTTSPAGDLLMRLAGREPVSRYKITDVPSCSRLDEDGPLLPADWRLTVMPGGHQLVAALRDLSAASAALHEVARCMRSDERDDSGLSQSLFSISTLIADAIAPLKAYE